MEENGKIIEFLIGTSFLWIITFNKVAGAPFPFTKALEPKTLMKGFCLRES